MKTASAFTLAFAFIVFSPIHAQQPKLRTTLQANGQVLAVAFSPDSQMLATKSFDGTIKLWDVSSGKVRTILQGRTDRLRIDGVVPSNGTLASVAFTNDGKLLASGSLGNTIKLWDVETGKVKTIFNGHTEPVTSVAFSRDGNLLASSSFSTTKLWDLKTEQVKAILKEYPFNAVFSPDSKLLASVNLANAISIWNVKTAQERVIAKGHKDFVCSVAFSPDGFLLASGSRDMSMKLWDVTSGQEKATFMGKMGWVMSVVFSPDGKNVASGNGDEIIRLWDVATGKERVVLNGHKDAVSCVAFSPDGKTLASGSLDGTIKLWDVKPAK